MTTAVTRAGGRGRRRRAPPPPPPPPPPARAPPKDPSSHPQLLTLRPRHAEPSAPGAPPRHLGEPVPGVFAPRRGREAGPRLLPGGARTLEVAQVQAADADMVERLGYVRRLGEGCHEALEGLLRLAPLLLPEIDDRLEVRRVYGGFLQVVLSLLPAEIRPGLAVPGGRREPVVPGVR